MKIGDSTTETGIVPNELSRRLRGTEGYTDYPEANNLNVKLMGRCHANAFGVTNPAKNECGWEATGGWTWDTYNNYTVRYIIKLDVTDAKNVNQGDSYRTNTNGILIISEINVDKSTGAGVIRGYWTYNGAASCPTSPGSLTKYDGYGQDKISYTNATVESYSPFAKSDGTISFIEYVDQYLESQLDIVIFNLGINSGIVSPSIKTNYDGVINQAKRLIDVLHYEYPDCKVIIDGLILPCQNMAGT